MHELVIVGGGIAGLCAALRAPAGARVLVIDKGELGAGSSPLAQGGMAAAVGPEDRPELHAKDTVRAGAGICDADVVADVCAEGPAAVDWLVGLGCAFDRTPDGELDLAREGGQSVPRSVHRADATGAEIVRALRAAVQGRAVERVGERASQLVLHQGRCIGVMAGGRAFTGRATLLATGGAGALWGKTTNAPGATADGVALAAEAGAQLADLEFMQFHPTALDAGSDQRVLLTEALRGEGAILVDRTGERFVDELAPRHVVTKAILDRGGAFLDCRGVAHLEERFPTVVAGARARGFDPATALLPVYPAAHYFIGGVAADAWGRTSVPGLFAAGECAATGMHGANRMAGNSLLETVVVGGRVGARVLVEPAPPWLTVDGGFEQPLVTMDDRARGLGRPDPEIAVVMWEGVGPIRNADGLHRALGRLAAVDGSPHRDLFEMVARAALARAESRGVHIRSDLPAQDDAFASRAFDRRPQRVRD